MTAERPDRLGSQLARAPVVIAAVVSVVLVVIATGSGIGITLDSAAYVVAARSVIGGFGSSVLAGDGAHIPLTHFPPGLPMALAAGAVVGMDPIDFARWMNAALMACNVILIASMARAVCNDARVAGIIGAAFAAASVDLLQCHSAVLSEPLALWLQFMAFWLVAAALRTNAIMPLLFSCVAMACALLTRFATLPAIAVVALALLFDPSLHRVTWRRVVVATTWAALALAPLVAWAIWVKMHGAASVRRVGFHPIALDNLRLGARTVSMWILPYFVSRGAASAVLISSAAVVVAILWFSRFRRQADREAVFPLRDPLLRVLAIYAVVYPLFLIVSISFVDRATQLISRILLPEYICVVVLAIRVGFVTWRRADGDKYIRVAGAALCAIVLLGYFIAGTRWSLASSVEAAEYNARSWTRSRLLNAIGDLPLDVPVYSNVWQVVEALTRRPAYPTGVARALGGTDEWVSELRRQCVDNGGLLVYFRNQDLGFLMPEEEVVELLRLPRVLETCDGNVYMDASHAATISFLRNRVHGLTCDEKEHSTQ